MGSNYGYDVWDVDSNLAILRENTCLEASVAVRMLFKDSEESFFKA
jgi:hypothetical protein